jgi:hypothetical protein
MSDTDVSSPQGAKQSNRSLLRRKNGTTDRPVRLPIVIGFRTISVSAGDWLRTMVPAGSACLVMSAVVVVVRATLAASMSDVAALAITAAAGAAAYGFVLLLLFWRRLRGIIALVRAARSQSAAPFPAPAS